MSDDPATLLRLARLERMVRGLYEHLGLPEPTADEGVSPQVRRLVQAGNLIGAIKLHRGETGKGLAEAKADVEALRAGPL